MQYNQHKRQAQHYPALFEGLEQGDLARLTHPRLHIDEFESKMGDDSDIIVLSFKVDGKEPALDLMNFIERGYEWILDSDVSSGELDDGEYIVFAELERTPAAAEHIVGLLKDMLNLTGQDLEEWKFQYRKSSNEHDINEEEILSVVPHSSADYEAKYGSDEDDVEVDLANPDNDEDAKVASMIGAMQESARVPTTKTAPKNAWTESLRVAAGLK